MLDKIKELENVAIRLESDSAERDQWNEAILDYSNEFLETIRDRKTYNKNGQTGEKLMKLLISEKGRSIEELISLFDSEVTDVALNPASGGHLGYIPGGGIFPTALGDYLAAISNEYAGIFFASPGAVRMENMLIRWMCDLVGYPKESLGNLTSGGSIANLIAIATARDYKKIRPRDIEKSAIYLTNQVHHSLQKAIRIAGLGEAQHRYVPMDDRFRMDSHILQEMIDKDIASGLKPFLLIGSAGTTDTGSVDPLDELAELSQKHDMWFHIDAAYGGFFLLTEEVKAAFKGIEKSDSVTIDPHKGLFLAYGSGAVLIKNVDALQETHYYRASYMQDALGEGSEPNPADLSPELTKHFRGMRMWLPLQLHGLERFRAALSEKIWLTRYFYDEIQKLGFEVGPFPELSVAIYRYVPQNKDANEFNKAIVNCVHEDGRVFISSTTIEGQVWLRLAILNFRTHLREVTILLEVLKDFVQKNA